MWTIEDGSTPMADDPNPHITELMRANGCFEKDADGNRTIWVDGVEVAARFGCEVTAGGPRVCD